jgi:hypothetical protein
LLADADVQAEITRQRAILIEESNVTPERIVAELAVIAFSDLGDYIRIHPDGTASIELGNMPPGATRAIASVDVVESRSGGNRTRIKLHDKQAALVSLAKMFGMLTGDAPGLAIIVNDAEKVELRTLTTDQLRQGVALLALSEGAKRADSGPDEAVSTPDSADSEADRQDSPTATARTGGESNEPTSLLPSDPS